MEGDECKNDDLHRRATNARNDQEVIPIRSNQGIRNHFPDTKRDILSLAYRQGCVFKQFKESNELLDTIKKTGISVSMIT